MAELTQEAVREALHAVSDPELGFDIVELGLVRTITITDEEVKIDMTLTTPACPYGPVMLSRAEETIKKIAGDRKVVVHLVLNPPWNPEKEASEDVLAAMGRW